MKRYALPILACLAIIGCAANNRNTPGDFEMIRSGTVPRAAVPAFGDCVAEAFQDRTVGLGVIIFNREQRRASMRRVELVGNETGPVLSADVFDDGRYELHQIYGLFSFRLEDERAAFDACATKHQK